MRKVNNKIIEAEILYSDFVKAKGNSKRKIFFAKYYNLIRHEAYKGNSDAQFIYGNILELEDFGLKLIGKKMNKKRALFWYSKSCNSGNSYACHNLGGIYGMGEVVKMNKNKEIELYKKAFSLGSIQSAFSIAICYEERGNIEEALKWLVLLLESKPEKLDLKIIRNKISRYKKLLKN